MPQLPRQDDNSFVLPPEDIFIEGEPPTQHVEGFFEEEIVQRGLARAGEHQADTPEPHDQQGDNNC